mmetsp:Transcript_10611/g.15496  ORF Transcript_10611/g.15496 Transcript_10611/m.15496 type:complete len:110 (+) Transcript_10611:838-1167(+)
MNKDEFLTRFYHIDLIQHDSWVIFLYESKCAVHALDEGPLYSTCLDRKDCFVLDCCDRSMVAQQFVPELVYHLVVRWVHMSVLEWEKLYDESNGENSYVSTQCCSNSKR